MPRINDAEGNVARTGGTQFDICGQFATCKLVAECLALQGESGMSVVLWSAIEITEQIGENSGHACKRSQIIIEDPLPIFLFEVGQYRCSKKQTLQNC